MSARNARLAAVDGVNGAAVMAMAKSLATADGRGTICISQWDASGIFGEVVVAEDAAGSPSARTLLLLYAADLAFRLRWEIKPALDEGLCIVAAPYVNTAIAFGRATGLDEGWLADMFRFAPAPDEHRLVTAPAAGAISERRGFVEFACQLIGATHAGPPRRLLIGRTSSHVSTLANHRAKTQAKGSSHE